MENIWGYTLSATIYGSIAGIVILVIKVLMKNKLNKKYAYLLWMILIIKLVMPFGPESSFSLFNQIPIKINSQVNMNNSSNINEYIIDTDYEGHSSKNTSQEAIITQSASIINNESEKSIFINVIPLVWISGAVLTSVSYTVIYLHFMENIRKKENIKYDYLESVLNGCKEKLHIKRKINIVVDDMINSPSLIGIWKIRIIIPNNLTNLSKEELQHIFLHELCHFKSKDTWVDNMLVFLQCIHWFNPIIWYLFKQMRNDMEMACDERVLSVLNEKDHNKYGLTMLTVLEKVNYNKKFALGLNMADDKKTIKKRVELIKNSKHFLKKKKILTITGLICLLVMGGALLTNGNSINEDTKTVLLPIAKNKSEDLDDCISDVIIEKYAKKSYGSLGGEFITESHAILGQDEYEDYIEVYLVTTYGVYGFENNIFSMIGGSSQIPMRIKFLKNEKISGYDYVNSEEAKDGSYYVESVKKMFPTREAYKALNLDYTDQLNKDIYKKAVSYVKNIGRDNEVAYDYLDKTYIDELALKNMSNIKEIEDYPEWIGTRETIKSGKRYIYKTEYDYSSNILTFTKLDENKSQIEMLQYKINGEKLEKIQLK